MECKRYFINPKVAVKEKENSVKIMLWIENESKFIRHRSNHINITLKVIN
jgi:hypothetical protein